MANKQLNELKDFFTKHKKVNLPKNETLIRADEYPKGIYFLNKGYVKMNTLFEDGSEITVNIFKPNSFFPMIWAFSNTKSKYFYQTITPIEAYLAPKDKVLAYLKDNPDALFDLTKRVMVGLDGLLGNLQNLLHGSADARISSALLILSKRFGLPQKDGSTIINLRFTHQDIANLAGVTRETASIILKKFEKDNLISYRKRLIIVYN